MSKHPFQERLRFGSNLGIERITKLCAQLGDPQHKFRSIHVAGTNGKGSTAAFLASILEAHDYQVGLYTSPHLVNYRERFQINGKLISEADLNAVTEKVKTAISEIEAADSELGSYTEFEATTAAAFLYFALKKVDYCVVEVGLGGRLDATNVIIPELSVITSIGHDHQDRLGNTLTSVAREKAGIIKSNVPVVSSIQLSEVDQLLRATADQHEASYQSLNVDLWQPGHWDLTGGDFFFPSLSAQPFSIKMVGKHQLVNAATATLAMVTLQKQGFELSLAKLRQGLVTTSWPGRLQLISHDPLVIYDGAHNRESIAALADTLAELIDSKITFVIGMSGGKSPQLLQPLFSLASRIYFTAMESSRSGVLAPEILRDYAQKHQVAAEIISLDQVAAILTGDQPVCVCGSLYLIGDLQRIIPD